MSFYHIRLTSEISGVVSAFVWVSRFSYTEETEIYNILTINGAKPDGRNEWAKDRYIVVPRDRNNFNVNIFPFGFLDSYRLDFIQHVQYINVTWNDTVAFMSVVAPDNLPDAGAEINRQMVLCYEYYLPTLILLWKKYGYLNNTMVKTTL